MSAQFIDIYEIGSDAPITTTTDKLKPSEKPLNLTVEMNMQKIIIKTGLKGNIYKSLSSDDLAEYNRILLEIKKQYPKENAAILKPAKDYKYENIVKVIDKTREIEAKDVYVTAIDHQNKRYPSKVLFDRIIFETQD